MSQKDWKNENNINSRKKTSSLSTQEFLNFISQSLSKNDKNNKRVNIGQVAEEAQKRINDLYGRTVSNIDIDSSGVRHAHGKKAHNLESDDLLYAVDTINTTPNIYKSDKQHENCDVLEFDDDRDGPIKFLTEMHVDKNYIKLFDAWRKQKARRRPDAAFQPPGAHAQDGSPRATKATRDRDATVSSSPQLTSKTNLVHDLSDSNITQSVADVNRENYEKKLSLLKKMEDKRRKLGMEG